MATVADLETVIDVLRPEWGGDDISLCLNMGVCPMGLLHDGFSLEAHALHNALSSGAPWPWAGGYYSQPAIFAQARGIIAAEEAKIQGEDAIACGQ